MVIGMTTPIIPTLAADIKDLAEAMIELHGRDSEAEAEQRASACQARGAQSGCEAWWRVAAAIREVMGLTPAAPPN